MRFTNSYPRIALNAFFKINRNVYHVSLMRRCLSAAILVLTVSRIYAQCAVVPPEPNCSVSGAIPLTNGASVNTGQTYVVTGSSTFSNITMNGGTLIVCGSLTISNTLTYNSGTLSIPSSGTFNYVGSGSALVLGSNSTIYNYGNFTSGVSIVTGANNLIMNCSITSQFTIPFNQFVIQGPNTQFANNGSFNSSFFIVQNSNSANVVCSGTGSVISTGTMINQYANAFVSPGGASCVQITNQIINSQPMTSSSNVVICYNSSTVGVSGSPNFGAATISNPCSSCSVPLPTELVTSSAGCENMKIQVSWSAESEQTCEEYVIQRSENGFTFEDAMTVSCQNNLSPDPAVYAVELDPLSNTEEEYIRLKRVDNSGEEIVYDVLQVDCSKDLSIYVYPTWVTDDWITVTAPERIESIILYSMQGKQVQSFLVEDEKETSIRLNPEVAIGQYLLSVKTKNYRNDKLLRILR